MRKTGHCHLGLIEIEPGRRLVNVFRFSNRWRTIDAVEAVRLAALAREVKPHRTFERREPKVVKPSKPKHKTVERPRVMLRRVPSLPTMPWQDDGRCPSIIGPVLLADTVSRELEAVTASSQ